MSLNSHSSDEAYNSKDSRVQEAASLFAEIRKTDPQGEILPEETRSYDSNNVHVQTAAQIFSEMLKHASE